MKLKPTIKTIFILTIILSFYSCNNDNKQIKGGWLVHQAYYNNKPVIWDLYGNNINLRTDNTCLLPEINNFQNRTNDEGIGTWKIFKQDGKQYLEIQTTNKIFRRTFEVYNLRKVQDSVSLGYFMKMTLLSDSLKLECTKIIF